MKISAWLLGGFASTIVLTMLLSLAQGLRLTRMNIMYLLGTMFTPHRDRAKLVGVGLHLLNGWVFALIYVAAFHHWIGASWWRGALVGLVHAVFVLGVAMPTLPALHPRMASEETGPTPTRQLEPPGFFALHYGIGTPVAVIVAHIVYGSVLGMFYRLGT